METTLRLPSEAFDFRLDELPKTYEMVRGVPAHFLTSALPHIERMAAQGLEPGQIAARLNLSLGVLMDAAKRFEDVRMSLVGGRARGADELSASLYNAGINGNVAAAGMLLKTKHGFVAVQQVEVKTTSQQDLHAPVTIEHAESLRDAQALLIEGLDEV